MIAFDSLGLPADYDCRIVAEPAASSRRGPGEGDLVVRVAGAGGEWERSWRGMGRDYPLTGVYAAPSGRHLFVIAEGEGFHVPADRPDDWTSIPGAPILGLGRVPGLPIVVFWGFQDLAAYGPDGMLWWLDHLSLDDLRVDRIEAGGISGTVWDPGAREGEDDRVGFRVDPWTGRLAQPEPHPGPPPELRISPPDRRR